MENSQRNVPKVLVERTEILPPPDRSNMDKELALRQQIEMLIAPKTTTVYNGAGIPCCGYRC